MTPLKIGNTLYLCTPHNWAIALDATTGKEVWRFDPGVKLDSARQHQTCRGVTYFNDATAAVDAPCKERVYLPVSDARLIALDAKDGMVCTTFANQGQLQLQQGMPYNPSGYYYSPRARHHRRQDHHRRRRQRQLLRQVAVGRDPGLRRAHGRPHMELGQRQSGPDRADHRRADLYAELAQQWSVLLDG